MEDNKIYQLFEDMKNAIAETQVLSVSGNSVMTKFRN